ncbi:unnamed protein product [Kluyveromyces dobzhanskii CBS 2104]|uniref:WGS project CCBQ000000000 data, contig 00011 n=1 Tax=Kluyveromyces dobzhanskii CBS 2104 TaxID=1427455 RepID=A0A0A8L816_9SACH|nr:unnamed protein product [Kluyveromyces dobzhanskii CBS 2104]
MSDSDSDDFFLNQNVSEDEDLLETAENVETSVNSIQTLPSSKNDKKRSLEDDFTQRNKYEPPPRKLTKQQGLSLSSNNNEIGDASDLSSDNPANSESDDFADSFQQEGRPANALPSTTTQDDMFDFLKEVTSSANKYSETYADKSTTKRIYNINFVSTLEGSQNKRVNVKVKGNKTFESILPITIRTFIQSYKIPRSLRMFYTPADLVLFRAGIEVLPFSSCDSLRIPQPDVNDETSVDLIIVHSSDANNYKTEYKNIRESRLQSVLKEKCEEDLDQFDKLAADEKFDLFEKELENAPKLEKSPDDVIDLLGSDNEVSSSLQLILIDKTNKRTSISVWPSTTFSEIAMRYKTMSKLPENANVLIIFDNVELDSAATVSSEDLEEDDILEIRLA